MPRREVKLSPSIYAADFGHLQDEIAAVEKAHVDMLHIDVMDGHFVELMAFGPDHVRMIRSMTSLPLDVHLMLERPERVIDMFIEAGADSISIHQESTVRLVSCLRGIHAAGIRTGVVLSPATSPETIRYALDDTDMVLVMTINPGEHGQRFQETIIQKIAATRELIRNYDIDIEVDGDINVRTIQAVRSAGANIFVSGRYLFSDPVKHVRELRELAEEVR